MFVIGNDDDTADDEYEGNGKGFRIDGSFSFLLLFINIFVFMSWGL